MEFCQEILGIPKGIMKTRFEPRLPRMSQWKSYKKTLKIWPQAPLTGPSKLIQNITTNLSMSRSQLREQICQTRKSDRQEWQSLVVLNGTKIFLNGTNISFLKFMCGILNRGVANSFWNHVIQISSRQMYFQDIYSNLWKVTVFIGNIYSWKSNTYYRGTVMFVQDGFLYLIVTKYKLTVRYLKASGNFGETKVLKQNKTKKSNKFNNICLCHTIMLAEIIIANIACKLARWICTDCLKSHKSRLVLVYVATTGNLQNLDVYDLAVIINSYKIYPWTEEPERPERDGPCWLLKPKWMETQRIQMKGVLLWFVRTLFINCEAKIYISPAWSL